MSRSPPTLSSLVRSVLREASSRSEDPRDVLRRIGAASEEASHRILGRDHPAYPEVSLADGTFGGRGPQAEIDGEGMLVLRRVAGDRQGVLKDGSKRRASLSDLMAQSEFHGGGGDSDAISLSADPAFTHVYGIGRHATRTVGTFRIPPADLIALIGRGEATLGNVGEREIIASGRAMAPYLVGMEGEGDEDAGAISLPGNPPLSDDVAAPEGDLPPPPPPPAFSPL